MKVVVINFTQPLMVGSITATGGGLDDLIYDGDSEGGLEADSREFNSWEDDDFDDELE